MVVLVWYENVPFFCFICGRIGHSDKECFEGEVGEGEFSYGVCNIPATPGLTIVTSDSYLGS
jgi:hypothetical protein